MWLWSPCHLVSPLASSGGRRFPPLLETLGQKFQVYDRKESKEGGYADVGARPLLDDQAGGDQLGSGQLKGCYSAYRFLNNVGLMKLQWGKWLHHTFLD